MIQDATTQSACFSTFHGVETKLMQFNHHHHLDFTKTFVETLTYTQIGFNLSQNCRNV